MSETVPTDNSSDSRAAERLRQAGYLAVRNLLPRPILDYLKAYYRILQANGTLTRDAQAPLSLSVGGDSALDAVLEFVGPEIGLRVGLDLAPTYSYSRIYMKDDRLSPHLDRDACEISVSVCIETPPSAGPSVLHFKRPGRRVAKVSMREGDGCIYMGREVEHWRDPIPEDGYVQLFLHFIDKGGPRFPDLLYDRRRCLGAPYDFAAGQEKSLPLEDREQRSIGRAEEEGRIVVSLLLNGGHERKVRLGADDRALVSLLEAVAKRNDERTQATVFNLAAHAQSAAAPSLHL